ncbi:MAG: hydrogenase iron-sulfur subunit, partial [Thermodesulfobacteriota bacterium]
PERCASCGICVGACEYQAIDLPNLTEGDMKDEIKRLSVELREAGGGGGERGSVFVFLCKWGVESGAGSKGSPFEDLPWVTVMKVPCIGMVQPLMLAIPFEEGVDGVLVAGCRPIDCNYRYGNAWFAGRFQGYRPPVVRRSLDRDRVRYLRLSAVETDEFGEELGRFHEELREELRGGGKG